MQDTRCLRFCHHLLLKDREQYFIQLIQKWAILVLVAIVLKASHEGNYCSYLALHLRVSIFKCYEGNKLDKKAVKKVAQRHILTDVQEIFHGFNSFCGTTLRHTKLDYQSHATGMIFVGTQKLCSPRLVWTNW